MRRFLGNLALIGVGAVMASDGAAQDGQRSRGVASVTYVLEVDPARAEALGWVAKDASEAQAVESVASLVRRRFEAMERALRIQTDPATRRIELTMPQIQPRERELFAEMLRNLGVCEFLFFAEGEKDAIDLAREQEKLDAWRRANPSQPLALFHVLAASEGPHRRLLWSETLFAGTAGRPEALLLPDRPEACFGAAGFARVYASLDDFGYPCLGFKTSDARAADFEALTGANVSRRLGLVIEDRVRSAPTLMAKLIGQGLIEGRFTEQETAHFVESFQELAGPLKLLEIR
ncbi:MAG: hypothetical protein HOP15_02480 [Planctomycetes bacterium]|nr:hypothetical protein [Planctomycetota bacterium]